MVYSTSDIARNVLRVKEIFYVNTLARYNLKIENLYGFMKPLALCKSIE